MAAKTGTVSELKDVLSSGMIVEVQSGKVIDPFLNTKFAIGHQAFSKKVIDKVCCEPNTRYHSELLLPDRQPSAYVSDRTNLKVQRQLRKIDIDPVSVEPKKSYSSFRRPS